MLPGAYKRELATVQAQNILHSAAQQPALCQQQHQVPRGLCCFQAAHWQAHPQDSTTQHPMQMQLRPNTNASSASADMQLQLRLLQLQGTAKHKQRAGEGVLVETATSKDTQQHRAVTMAMAMAQPGPAPLIAQCMHGAHAAVRYALLLIVALVYCCLL